MAELDTIIIKGFKSISSIEDLGEIRYSGDIIPNL